MAAAALLAACVPFSKDGGFDEVARRSREQLGAEVRWTRTENERAAADARVARLLGQPLTAEAAVQVALLNSPALQAAFEELGISEAALVQASRPPNPGVTLRHADGGGALDVEQLLIIDVLGLAVEPLAVEVEKRRFAAAQEGATLTAARLAVRTRRAYYTAVAAAESVRLLERVGDAADSAAELARRMRAAGNWSLWEEARQDVFATEAAQRLAAARLAAAQAREGLLRVLGIGAESPPVELAERLSDLPAAADRPPTDAGMLLGRLDLKIASQRLAELAGELRLVKATRFLSLLEAGPARVREGAPSQPYEYGYEVRLELPLFDGGGARLARARARYSQAVDRYAQAVIDARSEVRTADAAYRAAWQIAALQRTQAIPRTRALAAESLKRYYASQASVFDLLADARAEAQAEATYIGMVRDFWIATADLDGALLGGDGHVDP